MAFDECTPYPCEYDYARNSMHMTHRWLTRCVERFNSTEPLYGVEQALFPIVQGSVYKDLRKESAEYIASVNMPGNHNVLNALATICIATDEGVSDEAIVQGLYGFQQTVGPEVQFRNFCPKSGFH